MWSLGILLYVLLCGYLPFDAPESKKLYQLIADGIYELPAWMSLQAEAVVELLLQVHASLNSLAALSLISLPAV